MQDSTRRMLFRSVALGAASVALTGAAFGDPLAHKPVPPGGDLIRFNDEIGVAPGHVFLIEIHLWAQKKWPSDATTNTLRVWMHGHAHFSNWMTETEVRALAQSIVDGATDPHPDHESRFNGKYTWRKPYLRFFPDKMPVDLTAEEKALWTMAIEAGKERNRRRQRIGMHEIMDAEVDYAEWPTHAAELLNGEDHDRPPVYTQIDGVWIRTG